MMILYRGNKVENTKENSKDQVQDQVWDRVFKIMMQDHPALFIPFINMIFGKQYKRDVPITHINTETYNKDRSKIMSDIVFLIGNISYHIECQYSNDKTMVFRMFEYDFHIALMDSKRKSNFVEFNFPKSCVFYIVPKESMPKKLEMKINFQDGSYNYKVPVIRLYDYDLAKIEQNELFLFLPYEILRHSRNVTTEKNIAKYSEEINSVYSKIIDILETAYNKTKINLDEVLTLINMLKDTAENKLNKYPQIMEGVNEMLNNAYSPKWKIELEQEKKKTTKEVTKEVTKKVTEEVTIKVTKKVTKEVTEAKESTFLRLMKKNGIPEDQIRTIAIQGNIPIKIVDNILESDNEKQT